MSKQQAKCCLIVSEIYFAKIGAVSVMLIRISFVAGVARISSDLIVRLWFEYWGKKNLGIWKSFGN